MANTIFIVVLLTMAAAVLSSGGGISDEGKLNDHVIVKRLWRIWAGAGGGRLERRIMETDYLDQREESNAIDFLKSDDIHTNNYELAHRLDSGEQSKNNL